MKSVYKLNNFELIKSIIEVSNRESTDASTITANVTLIRFLKEYNYIYGTTFKTDKEITIPVKLVLSSTMVSSIEIDYKDIDNQVYELNRHIGIFSKWSVDRYDLSKSNDFDDF